MGTFHEPLVSLSFEGDLEDEEEEDDEQSTVEVIKEVEEEDDEDEEDEEEDVQLDNTPAEAADRRPQHRPPSSVVARPPLKSTTWAWYVAALGAVIGFFALGKA